MSISSNDGHELMKYLVSENYLPDLPFKSVQVNIAVDSLLTVNCEFIVDKEKVKKGKVEK